MTQLLSIILIGIALSMDTFSLSLSIGTFNISSKKALKISLIVASMHFIMPLFGMILGEQLLNIFEINCDKLLGIILFFIAIQMIIDIIKNEEEKFNLSLLGMFLFALGVSLDSFTVGLGINAITSDYIFAMTIFAICSFIFTMAGIITGKVANKLLGTYATIFGIFILLFLGITHLF